MSIFSTRNITADVLKIEDGKDRLPCFPRSAAAIRYDCDRTVAPGSMARSRRVASFFLPPSRARRLVNRPDRRPQRRVKLFIRHVHPQTLRQRSTEACAHPAARSQPPRGLLAVVAAGQGDHAEHSGVRHEGVVQGRVLGEGELEDDRRRLVTGVVCVGEGLENVEVADQCRLERGLGASLSEGKERRFGQRVIRERSG